MTERPIVFRNIRERGFDNMYTHPEPYNNIAETAISPSADLVSLLQHYEDGVLGPEEEVQLFQELIDSGWAWQLGGTYKRQARALILAGKCRGGKE